ncbi:MAG: SDR family NAD(P)-dependent oxidoreductase [Pyrinomonadaceae bacterium]|nr:SDR family NAD(P)-dependent oxidoreductase [Pyrinomonadaceae bacterium]
MFDWSRKTVFITGASSGIGWALAVELGRRGAAVALLARRAEALHELSREVEAVGGRALALPVDVRDAERLRAAVAEAENFFGKIDVLIANAGMGELSPARGLDEKIVADVFGVNVLGAINSVAAVLPQMLERGGGHLVAISSLAAYRGFPGSGAYCASKAALSTFFESLRTELQGSGVAVTTIHPGFIDTPMTRGRNQPMPYLMTVDNGARMILRAIEQRRRTYAFPWQLAALSRLIKLMPDALYDRLMRKALYRQ